MRHTNVLGIILKKRNFGEYDQSITFFCPELGKVEAVAKGARKIQSHFSGHLEPLTICNIQLYTSAYRSTITQCQTVKSFKNLQTTFESSIISIIVLEIVQKTVHASEHGQEIFDLIKNTLNTLDTNKKKFIHIETFKIKLLTHMGLIPDMQICHLCNERFNEQQQVQVDPQGHFYCGNCFSHGDRLPFGMIKLINFIAVAKTDDISQVYLTAEQKILLRNTTDSFLNPYIQSPLNSDKVLSTYL